MRRDWMPLPERLRFTPEEYHRMAEAGILGEDEPVELVRGEILVMTPTGSRHVAAVARLDVALLGLRTRALVLIQSPLRLADSEPQPDLLLLAPRDDFYASALPRPPDVLLLVEVADTSEKYDRDVKGPLYAENGIREYWLVDLASSVVEVHRRPEEGAYRETEVSRRGDVLSPRAFPDFAVRVAEVLP